MRCTIRTLVVELWNRQLFSQVDKLCVQSKQIVSGKHRGGETG